MPSLRLPSKLRLAITATVLGATAMVLATTLSPSANTSDSVGDNVVITDSATSPDGAYVYVVGSIMGSDGRDVFIAKYNQSGSDVSSNALDIAVGGSTTGEGNDYANAVAVDSEGHVFVTGKAESDDGTYSKLFVLRFPGNVSAGPTATYLYSNPNGNRMDEGKDIVLANDGTSNDRVFVTGNVGGSSGNEDIVTMKIANGLPGSVLWATTFSTGSSERAAKIAVNSDSGLKVYVAGQQGLNVLAIRYDTAGTEDWHNTWDYQGDGVGQNIVSGLAVEPTGTEGVYVSTSSTRSTVTGDSDIALVRFDKADGAVDGAGGWNAAWRTITNPDSVSVGVVLDPTTHKPLVGGTVGQFSGSLAPDMVIVRWPLNPGSGVDAAQVYGGAYSYEWASQIRIDAGTRVYLAGMSDEPTYVGTGENGEDMVGPLKAEAQIDVIAANCSDLSTAWDYLSAYPARFHFNPQLSVTADGNVFVTANHYDSPVGDYTPSYVDFFYFDDPSY